MSPKNENLEAKETEFPQPEAAREVERVILLKVIEERNVVGIDVVELAPIPGVIAPDFLAAKLVFKMLSRIFNKNGWIK